ncbi:MAG: biopolymer transport protein ExbB/TolQ [Oleispira sp.]|jgi:biopolymer transport protein ExbB/TolQ
MTVAFDTTVIGLLAGIIGFVLGRMRRRWYDAAMEAYETHAQEVATHG